MLQLQTRPIDDQPSRGLSDAFHFDKVMCLERIARFNKIDDPIS